MFIGCPSRPPATWLLSRLTWGSHSQPKSSPLSSDTGAYAGLVSGWRVQVRILLCQTPAHVVLPSRWSLWCRTDCFLMTWSTSLSVTTHPIASTKDRPSALQTVSSTCVMLPDVSIAKMIGDTSEPGGIPASTRCLSITVTWISISTVWSVRKFAVYCVRSPSNSLLLIVWIVLPLLTLYKAA